MKAFLIVAAIVVAMALVGWLTFSLSGDRASVSLETQDIKQDTERAVEKGKEWIDKAADKSKRVLDKPGDKPSPPHEDAPEIPAAPY